jgi:hypothetical protein
MTKKVLLTAAAAALLVIAAPQPAAKAMTGGIPALDQESSDVMQVRDRGGGGGGRSFGGGGGGRSFGGGGRGWGGGGRKWIPGGGGGSRAYGGGAFRAAPIAPRSNGWSDGGRRGGGGWEGRSRSFSAPYAGSHGFRGNGVRREWREGGRGYAREFEGRKYFDDRKVFRGDKDLNHRKFDDRKFGFRKFDDDRGKFFDRRKFDDRKFAFRKFDDDKFFRKRHRHALFFVGPLVDYAYDYNGYGCEWLKWKAIQTGSAYWWRRYERCRNGWDW